MEKTKLLTITVIGLLLLNCATLGFLFLNGSKGHNPAHERREGRPEPKEIIIERLNFDSNQQQEYDKLIEWHKRKIDNLDEEIRHEKYLLYGLLAKDTTDIDFKQNKQKIIDTILGYQIQVEETHFKHFQDIRKLCANDQLAEFDKLINDLPRIFSQNKPSRPQHE
jgi:protein CpxP